MRLAMIGAGAMGAMFGARFARPSADQVAAFKGVPTSFVVDALGGRGALDGAD